MNVGVSEENETGMVVANIPLKKVDAAYWNDKCMGIAIIKDAAFKTKHYMKMCADFAEKAFSEGKETDNTDHATFVTRAKDFFENYEEMDEKVFKELMFDGNTEREEFFEEFKAIYQEAIDIEDTAVEPFLINQKAVKKNSRVLKSEIELDGHIEIKIKSSVVLDKGLIVRGYDEEKKMSFYTTYFESEA